MKVRTQVQLEREDYLALKRLAAQRGTSVSAAVRWLVRENVRGGTAGPEKVAAFLGAAGKIADNSGRGSASQDHDRFLYGGE